MQGERGGYMGKWGASGGRGAATRWAQRGWYYGDDANLRCYSAGSERPKVVRNDRRERGQGSIGSGVDRIERQ